jgi:hypothetical protein
MTTSARLRSLEEVLKATDRNLASLGRRAGGEGEEKVARLTREVAQLRAGHSLKVVQGPDLRQLTCEFEGRVRAAVEEVRAAGRAAVDEVSTAKGLCRPSSSASVVVAPPPTHPDDGRSHQLLTELQHLVGSLRSTVGVLEGRVRALEQADGALDDLRRGLSAHRAEVQGLSAEVKALSEKHITNPLLEGPALGDMCRGLLQAQLEVVERDLLEKVTALIKAEAREAGPVPSTAELEGLVRTEVLSLEAKIEDRLNAMGKSHDELRVFLGRELDQRMVEAVAVGCVGVKGEVMTLTKALVDKSKEVGPCSIRCSPISP